MQFTIAVTHPDGRHVTGFLSGEVLQGVQAAERAQFADDVGGNRAGVEGVTAVAGYRLKGGCKRREAHDVARAGRAAVDQQVLACAGVQVDLGFQVGPVVGDAGGDCEAMFRRLDCGREDVRQ